LLPLLLSFSCSGPPPDLPSFPTRRSSDLSLLRSVPARLRFSWPLGAALAAWLFSHRLVVCRQLLIRQVFLFGHKMERHFEGFLGDRKSTRLNSSHVKISYAVFCLKKKKFS